MATDPMQPQYQPKDIKTRLYELFLTEKSVKWVYAARGRFYEPIFIISEGYGANNETIGRDLNGEYRIFKKNELLEAPPPNDESMIFIATEQLLKAYRRRYKDSSLRHQTMVEIIRSSKGWFGSGTSS
eukprot:287727_1